MRELRARHGLRADRYVLSVGTLEPRKNHARLVRAFDALAATRPDLRLVLAGARGWKSGAVDSAIAAAGARARIHVLGGVSADDLAALYSGATAFAYPSLYEGFGLPVLEAMAAGAPVLTSTVSSLPEVAGDAALLVDPDDSDAMAGAMHELLFDEALRTRLAGMGLARAASFTWERTARATAESLRRARRRGPG
jgi:glycosyltransferase involved in cell wall biosynthesis